MSDGCMGAENAREHVGHFLVAVLPPPWYLLPDFLLRPSCASCPLWLVVVWPLVVMAPPVYHQLPLLPPDAFNSDDLGGGILLGGNPWLHRPSDIVLPPN